MKRVIVVLLFLSIAGVQVSDAKLWSGVINSDWNNPGNWYPYGSEQTILISGTAPNWPELSANQTIHSLMMTSGSRLNLNGHTLFVAIAPGYDCDISGATISAGTMDLSGYGSILINGTTFTGDMQFDIGIFETLTEAGTAGNNYNGNVSFSIRTSASFFLGYRFGSTFNANLTINRIQQGVTNIFSEAPVALTGDFTCTNLDGGNLSINGNQRVMPLIGGKVRVVYNPVYGSPDFIMNGIRNNTGGGSILVGRENAGNLVRMVYMRSNSLLLDSVYLARLAIGDIIDNTLTGKIFLNSGGGGGSGQNLTLHRNIINGSSKISYTGQTFTISESGNTFNGNAEFTFNGGSLVNICRTEPSRFHGDLTINSYNTIEENIFVQGLAALDRDFSYTTNYGNLAKFNPDLKPMALIGGKLNINYSGGDKLNSRITLRGIRNATTGGRISLKNFALFEIERDTLVLDSLIIKDYSYDLGAFNAPSFFSFNDITGGISITDHVRTTGMITLRGNKITGNSNFNIAGNSSMFIDEGEERFIGNTVYNFGINSPATTRQISRLYPSIYNGNLTINKQQSGDTYLFQGGLTALNGNFRYSASIAGATYINGNSLPLGKINGTVNINIINSIYDSPLFLMSRVTNTIGGGVITIQNGGQVRFLYDTLIVNEIAATGFKSAGDQNGIVYSSIAGNVTISDGSDNRGEIYLFGNTITGNVSIKTNSTANFYQGNFGQDIINGDFNIEHKGTGTIHLAYASPIYIKGNLYLNSNSGLSFTDTVNFIGNANTNIEQVGTQPLVIPKLRIMKETGKTITLADTLIVSNKLNFVSGILNCSNKALQFENDATHDGSSASSHVVGKVIKVGNDAFTFPIGNGNSLHTVTMTAPSGGNHAFSAQYFQRSPGLDGYNNLLFQQIAPNPIKRVSGCEYWDIRRVNGNSNVGLTLSYGASPCAGGQSNYILDPSKARVVHWNGSIWQDLGNGGFSGTTTGTVSTAALVNSFSPFTLASTDIVSNPLPLTLLSFEAFRRDRGVELVWNTENEINVSHYEVQRSANDNQFNTISTVTAANIAGQNQYSTMDFIPLKGDNYYRLKTVDIDGRLSYSRIVHLEFDHVTSFSVWPNPLKRGEDLKLVLPLSSGPVNLKLINVQGQVVKQWSKINAGNYSITVNVSDQPTGVYIMQLEYGSQSKSLKLVIQ